MHYISSQDFTMHWNGNWNKLLQIHSCKSQCFVTIWLLMIMLPVHIQNTMALWRSIVNPLRMDVFCLYHSHGAAIKYCVFPKHSRTVCMHYLHILAKLLVKFFLSVTRAVYNVFCKHWVFSKYDMNCIAQLSEKLICAQNTCM